MHRRDFLIKTGLTAAGCAAGGLHWALGAEGGPSGASLIIDPADTVASSGPARWAADELQAALTAGGLTVRRCERLDQAPEGDLCLVVAGPGSATARDAGLPAPFGEEALAIGPGRLGSRAVAVAAAGGVRGLVFALTELTDIARDDPRAALQPARAALERAENPVRSVMRCFTSSVEDPSWYHDRDFWRRYLTMLVTHRFNRFNLAFGLGYDAPNGLRDTYLYFAYPFLLDVPGHRVRAVGLPDTERDRNLETLRFVGDEAARRGLEFQLGLWTHAYAWTNSPRANFVIDGLSPATQGPYCRDALALLLKECPAISGVTFRIHGESGVPEGSYDLWRTIFDGCVRADRGIRIDMHAKGMTEQMIAVARGTGLPFAISPKFWAEHLGLPYHQAGIRQTEMPKRARGQGAFAFSEGARSFLRYGYGDLLNRDRPYGILYRVWPGTQRLLLWGDAAFGAGYGRAMGFGGAQGGEIFEPLSFKGREGSGVAGGRNGYADASLRPSGGDFEKYALTYRYWGRLLYRPGADPEGWRRQFRRDYGAAAERAEVLLRHASRILPLVTTAHLPSASNNSFWPEMYTNMAMAAPEPPRPYSDTPTPRRFGTVSPLDPQLFSGIEEHAEALLRGRVDGRYSPVEVAQYLEDLAHATDVHLEETIRASTDRGSPAFRRLELDCRIQAGLGWFFARKLRAGVLFAIYQRTGSPEGKEQALALYRQAAAAWERLASAAEGKYAADVSFGDARYKRGHWSDRLEAIRRDLAAVEQAQASAEAGSDPGRVATVLAASTGRPRRPEPAAAHYPPLPFRRDQPIPLAVAFTGEPAPERVRLHYRQVNQAEAWRSTEMARGADRWSSEIPAETFDTNYSLQYYFEPTDSSGVSWIHPGLGSALSRQPYFVLHPA